MCEGLALLSAQIYVGTSGWAYRHWREKFYQTTPQRDWLSFYAQRLKSVEINGTFYRLQNPATLEKWYSVTPEDFYFSLKANRYLTHNKKLLDPESSIVIEREHSRPLRDKLKVVLWQLPANFYKNVPRLEAFVSALSVWNEVRHTIEFRHSSWFDNEVKEVLTKNHVAICQSDAADWPMWSAISTNLVYVRLHGHTATYSSSYSTASLKSWAEKIRQWHANDINVYIYFDNDAYTHAPVNAMQLRDIL